MERIYRHRLVTRVTHWINVAALLVLLGSGLQIFNAHPRLYWGQAGANADRAFIEMVAEDAGDGHARGVTRIGSLTLVTTGVLGFSGGPQRPMVRGFPAWATLPSWQDLATGRRWHFAAAWLFVLNGLVYLGHGFASGHVRRDLAPSRDEIAPRRLARDVLDHLRLHRARGEAAKRYNPLQKLTYLAIVFVVLPLMLLTGLTMSPGVDAAVPVLLDLFGGRQSARTIHFLCAALIVLFVLVHLIEVLIEGPVNEIRSMITGWYRVRPEGRGR